MWHKKSFTTIALIIFSKDRPFQVNSLLQSIQENLTGNFNIMVLYTTSEIKFRKAYRKLFKIWKNVDWVEQDSRLSFKQNLLDLMQPVYTHVGFLVDDNVVIRKMDLNDLIRLIQKNEIATIRLGINITESYMQGIQCKKPKDLRIEYTKKDNNEYFLFLRWRIKKQKILWNYMRALDGSFFRSEFFLRMISKVNFQNPNQLESEINKNTWSDYGRNGISTVYSSIVNLPLNKVQTYNNNRSMNISTEELLVLFNDNITIDHKKLSKEKFESSHVEINLFDFLKKDNYNDT